MKENRIQRTSGPFRTALQYRSSVCSSPPPTLARFVQSIGRCPLWFGDLSSETSMTKASSRHVLLSSGSAASRSWFSGERHYRQHKSEPICPARRHRLTLPLPNCHLSFRSFPQHLLRARVDQQAGQTEDSHEGENE